MLTKLAENKKVILIAGSYGKSTVAALLAHCLERAGRQPSYFIGASPLTPETPAKLASGEYFVIEGDEYPSSNIDSRAKFLHFNPTHALITPIAHDHFNVFPTPSAYLKPFTELIPLVSEGLVVCTDSELSGRLLKDTARPVVTYGESGEFTASDIHWGETTRFTLTREGKALGELETTLLGRHNIENIVGAAALVLSQELLSIEELTAGVETFKGVRRRLDRKSQRTIIPIFEGFGSSKEKLRAVILAMRLHFPERRLIVVFEPHTFSWRRRESLSWYEAAFKGASKVYLFEPPQDGKEAHLSLEEMTERIQQSGIAAEGAADPETILRALEKELERGDCVLISSSGAMGGLIESIPALAERLYPLS